MFKKIRNYLLTKKINKRLFQVKYVHLMFNDKFNKPFVDFLNRNFDMSEHLILCKRFFTEHPFPDGSNVIEIKKLKYLNFAQKNIQKIICHSLFDADVVNYLYKNPQILKEKAYWGIWGGDLYNAPRDKKNDFVRSNFKGYLTPAEKEIVENKYGIKGNFYPSSYTFPVNKDILDNVTTKEHKTIAVKINNSCDKSTLEMLDVLSKFKNENIKISTILSYGDMQYKGEIIKKGKEIFGDKFEYLDTFLPAQEYANYIANNNILILNQSRQQGFGNTLANLYLGNKVFIKKSSCVNFYLNNKDNIKIFNSDDIKNLVFEEFIANESALNNKQNVLKYLDGSLLKKYWKDIFDAK